MFMFIENLASPSLFLNLLDLYIELIKELLCGLFGEVSDMIGINGTVYTNMILEFT